MGIKVVRMCLPADSDGYTNFQCPLCGYEFRLSSQDVASETEANALFCPACGLESERLSFLSEDARRRLAEEAANILGETLNAWTDELERKLRGNKYVKFKKGEPFRPKHRQPVAERTDLEIVTLPCCGRTAKVSSLEATAAVYCPYCGVK